MFLDVHMPYLDGFGVLEAMDPARVPATVFVTAHDRYAVRAFEAQALDYLVKPYTDDRFAATLARACRLLPARAAAPRMPPPRLERLVIKGAGRLLLLEVHEIDWIEACGVYVNLHVGGRVHVYRSSVAQLLARLDPARFVRVHRSAAVNTARIRELQARSHGDYTVVLKDGTHVVLSRGYRAAFEQWLGQEL
jgi:two-component system LytT family response regulator